MPASQVHSWDLEIFCFLPAENQVGSENTELPFIRFLHLFVVVQEQICGVCCWSYFSFTEAFWIGAASFKMH